MASWFYRGLRRGIVTTRFPKGELDAWAHALPSPPAFRPAGLTPGLAARLAAACPSGAIELDADAGELLIDVGRCTGCGRCLQLAGSAAAPSGEFLLASVERRALVKRIPIEGGGGGDR